MGKIKSQYSDKKLLKYAEEVYLDFVRQCHRRWYRFHRDVQRLAEQQGLNPETFLFQNMRTFGNSSLDSGLIDADKYTIIAADTLRLDISTDRVAQTLYEKILRGLRVSLYLRRAVVDKYRLNPILEVLGERLDSPRVSVFLSARKLPVDFILIDNSLQYFDHHTKGLSPYVTSRRIPADRLVARYAKDSLDVLEGKKVDEAAFPDIPRVTLKELVDSYLKS